MRLVADPVGVAVWLAACLSALAWGGRPERVTAAMLLSELAAVCLLPGLSPKNAVHWWTLAWDVAVLAGMILLQMRWRREWLLTAIGFQIIAVLAHIPRIIDPGIRRWAYVAATTYAGYAVVLALVAGTLLHLSRRGERPCPQAS